MKKLRFAAMLLVVAAVAVWGVSCAPFDTAPSGTAPSGTASTDPTTQIRPAATTVPPATGAAEEGWRAGTAQNPKDLKGQSLVIADVPKRLGSDYFAAAARGMQEAAAELGNVTITTGAPVEARVEAQIEFLDGVIGEGVEGILFAANDPVAIAPVLHRALERGIHVVGYDADSQENAREFFVNQVNFDDFSSTVLDLVARNAGDDARVAIITSSVIAPNQSGWIESIKRQMAASYPRMRLLDIRSAGEDRDAAFTVAQDLMQAHPEMSALLGLASVTVPGAAAAVSQANECGQIYVIGASTPKLMKDYVNSGCVKHVVLWNPVDLGYAAVYAMRALADGTLRPGATELEAGRLGKLTITGSSILLGKPFVFDKGNINDFDF